jgi:hypothetical protein
MANCDFATKVEKKHKKEYQVLRAIWLLATNYSTYHFNAF